MSGSRRMRRGLAVGGTLSVLVTLGAAAATSASASAASTTGWVPTATLATSIPGAGLTGTEPASTPVHLAVTLRPQNAPAEQAALKAMYTAGSPSYHQFLTPSATPSRRSTHRRAEHRAQHPLSDTALTPSAQSSPPPQHRREGS